jgi:hypothetical protein
LSRRGRAVVDCAVWRNAMCVRACVRVCAECFTWSDTSNNQIVCVALLQAEAEKAKKARKKAKASPKVRQCSKAC